jgi:predicted anti-sigma-YlaC factor YlaD
MQAPQKVAGKSALVHPAEKALKRYAANAMGLQPKKTVHAHLGVCPECRSAILNLHDLARRYRDLERVGIARAVGWKA